ncbi:13508_t:CDS:2, partial [Gigaspora rosea]
SIEKTLDALKQKFIPVITAPNRARLCLTNFNTLLKSGLGMPRVSLVKIYVSTLSKVYSGSINQFNEDSHNIMFLLLLDKDALILIERYKEHIICLSATPINISNVRTIHLSKSKSLFEVTELPTPSNIHFESAVYNYLKEYSDLKILVILPLLTM